MASRRRSRSANDLSQQWSPPPLPSRPRELPSASSPKSNHRPLPGAPKAAIPPPVSPTVTPSSPKKTPIKPVSQIPALANLEIRRVGANLTASAPKLTFSPEPTAKFPPEKSSPRADPPTVATVPTAAPSPKLSTPSSNRSSSPTPNRKGRGAIARPNSYNAEGEYDDIVASTCSDQANPPTAIPVNAPGKATYPWGSLGKVEARVPILQSSGPRGSQDPAPAITQFDLPPVKETNEGTHFLQRMSNGLTPGGRLALQINGAGCLRLKATPSPFTTGPRPPWVPAKFSVVLRTESDPDEETMCSVSAIDTPVHFIQKVKGLMPTQVNTYIVRVVGTAEYLMDEDQPLASFNYVLESLKNRRVPEFTLLPKLPLQSDIESYLASKKALPGPTTMEQPYVGLPEATVQCYSASQLTKPLELRVLLVDNFEFDMLVEFFDNNPNDYNFLTQKMQYKTSKNLGALGFKLYTELSIVYAGNVKETLATREADTPMWAHWLKTGLQIANLPREARIVLTVHAKRGIARKPVALGWAPYNIFDFNGFLRVGRRVLRLFSGPPQFVGPPSESPSPKGLVLHMEIEDCGIPIFHDALQKPPVRARPLQLDLPEGKNLERVTRLFKSNPLHRMTEEEKQLVWKYRYFGSVAGMPNCLARVAQAANWFDPIHVTEMHHLVTYWDKLEPLDAIELLDCQYPDTVLRSFAVNCLRKLNDVEILEIVLQLVQTLNYEAYHDSDLFRWLFERALRNRIGLGHFLFWQLISGLTYRTANRYSLFLEAYLANCGDHLEMLKSQHGGIKRFRVLCRGAAKFDTPAKKLAFLNSELKPDFETPFQLPLSPQVSSSRILVDKCKFMDSAAMPLWVTFENNDKLGKPFSIIFKTGDDLRQDMLTLQMLHLMDKFWKSEDIDLHMSVYGVIATGAGEGMIEVVKNATTTGRIQKEYSGATGAFKKEPLATWLQQQNPNPHDYQEAVERFTHSCAGYCVGSYVLGLGDRHNDNIMVTKHGLLFHIDFAHFLGNIMKFGAYKRETAPFVLTTEFAYVMGDVNSANYKKFKHLCCRGYNILRTKAFAIIRLFKLMVNTNLPQLKSEQALEYLHTAFSLDLGHEAAAKKFQLLIDEAVNNLTTQINFFIHNLAHPLTAK